LSDLYDYLDKWSLSDPQLLTTTASSHIYKVRSDGEIVVLKLLTELGQADEASGAVALHIFNGRGAARLLRYDAQAQLIEYIDGEDLIPLVTRGDDVKATTIIAEVLHKLHSTSLGTMQTSANLISMKRWFRSLLTKASADEKSASSSIYRRAAAVAEALLMNPESECVLHGDIHHQNIRYHSQRGWLAFDPKGLYGERTFDAANTLCNPVDMPHLVCNETRLLQNVSILSDLLHIEVLRLFSFVFAYAALSASWSLEAGSDPQLALAVAEISEKHTSTVQ